MESNTRLNKSQAKVHAVNANVTHVLAPRGSGKTEGIIGTRIIRLSQVMPRSQSILYSDTFERIEGVLIPNIMNFIGNKIGLVEDQDYVVFKKPPDTWIKPFIVPRKFDRVVSWRTGFALCCASSFKDGSANGFNAQSGNIEETKWVAHDRITSQLYRALRGEYHRFGHLPEYRSVWSVSDKWQGNIDWILNIRDGQNNKLVQAVFSKQLKIYEWEQDLRDLELAGASEATLYRLKKRIIDATLILNRIRRELQWVCDAEPKENIDVLGEKWFRDAKRDIKTIEEYNVSILNHDPSRVEHEYYPDFDDSHLYEDMDDIKVNQPLIISMDYNWRIVCMEVSQISVLPGRDRESFNTVASVHAIEPNAGISQCVASFDELMTNEGQQNKTVYYVYDSTAVARDPGRASLHKIVIKELTLRKWKVIKIYIKDSMDQAIRFHKTKEWLTDPTGMPIMVNRYRAASLANSIRRTGALTSGGKTRKDKRPETKKDVPPENAPHHGEAWDQSLCAVYDRKRFQSHGSVPAILGSR